MLKLIDHFSTASQNYVSPSQTEIEIPFRVAQKLNALEVGDHTYISIVGRNGRAEITKYTHTGPVKSGVITVERDVGKTGAMNFPAGSCVTIDMNSVILSEYVASVVEEAVQAALAAKAE